jgi:hypothetical protein
MRNGIYRVWFKGSGIFGTAAPLLVDGQFVACDRSHTYLGSYTDANGRFSAKVKASRHTVRPQFTDQPDLDEFHMNIEGGSTEETIAARTSVPEKPGFVLDVEYIWCSEI